MYYRLCKFLAIIIVSSMVMACATTPKVKESDSDHIAAAKRFLLAFEADKLAMIGFKRAMETESKKHPEGVVEFTQRVMSDIKVEDVIDIIARIYARHLTQKHLTELARFAESPTGKRFIRMTIESVLEGDPAKAQNKIGDEEEYILGLGEQGEQLAVNLTNFTDEELKAIKERIVLELDAWNKVTHDK